MKLHTKFSIYNVAFSLVVFIIGGVLIYHFLYRITDHMTDESLRRNIQTTADKMKTGLSAGELETTLMHIRQLGTDPASTRNIYSDTTIYNAREHEHEPYRVIKSVRLINHRYYRFVAMQPLLEKEDVIATIFLSTLAVFLILIVLSSISNIIISRRIWKPFRNTLENIRQYRLSSAHRFQPSDTTVTEFRDLNTYIGEMIVRIENEYNALKEFTGNASHEMQTPLAIIRSKIELLSQTEKMDPDQARHLQAMNHAVARMTKLFRALLLLTKLENRQFEETTEIDFDGLIRQIVHESDEFIQQKQLEVKFELTGRTLVKMNADLAKIMLQNLISNAIRHNDNKGSISIKTSPGVVVISNTGPVVFGEHPERVFERFRKNPDRKGSIGLGLSVVRKICELYGFNIRYFYRDQWHHFEIDIPT